MSIEWETLTDEQRSFSFYYVTLCENGGSADSGVWDSDNYGVPDDPFTIGALQWAAGAAAQLIEVMREYTPNLFGALPQSWRDDVAVHPKTDYGFWYNRSITWDEHTTWCDAVAAHLEDAKTSQATMWYGPADWGESLRGYISSMAWCTQYTSDVKVFYYYMGCYHLSKEFAVELWNLVGDCGGDLDALANAAVNWLASNYTRQWPAFGEGWTNRLLVWALNPLKEWDGVSAPSDWGSVSGYPTGGGESSNIGSPSTGPSTVYSGGLDIKLAYVATFGNTVYAVDASGSRHMLLTAMANNVAVARLKPTENSYISTPATGGGSVNPPTTGWPGAAQAAELVNGIMGRCEYSQDWHSTDIYTTMKGDCSSLVYWTVFHVDQRLAAKLEYSDGSAGNTTVFQENCPWTGLSGYRGDYPGAGWEPGDILLMNYETTDSYMGGGYSGSHVGFIFDENTVVHQTPDWGPQVNTLREMVDSVLYWEIRRLPYD